MKTMKIKYEDQYYEMTADYHTHTVFSHGTGSIEDNVRIAHEKGLKEIGITDHGPGHVFYGVKRERLPEMRDEIERLKPLYPDMKIMLGVEANIVNKSGILDVKPKEFPLFDYVIAGYHYGATGSNPIKVFANHGLNLAAAKINQESKSLRVYNTKLIVNSIYANDIKILTHPGDKAEVDLLEIAVACAETDTLLELNTLHKSLTIENIKTMALADVKFVISSDAHQPKRVGDFMPAVKLALKAELDLTRIVNLRVTKDEV